MAEPYELHLNDDLDRFGGGRYWMQDDNGGASFETAMDGLECFAKTLPHPDSKISITIHAPCRLDRDHWWYENSIGLTLCYLCRRSYSEVVAITPKEYTDPI